MQCFVRKRTVVAIFVTLFIALIFNQYWIKIKPMPVSMDIKGKGSCHVEVVLNKKNNDLFTEVKSDSNNIDLDKDSHISFYVKRSRLPKKVKFTISNYKTYDKILLSNIRIGNSKLDKINEFIVDGASKTFENEKLILQPNKDAIVMIYPYKLKVITDIKFDFNIMMVILILSFLFAFKLSDYVADFETVQNKSKIEVIFLTIFFLFLFVPMSYINQDELSTQENRTLAKWHPFVKEDNEINFEFGKNFNEWFNDRFLLRKEFIDSYYSILSYFRKDYYENKVIIYNKKANFSYNKSYNSVNRYLRKDLFSSKELDTLSNNLTYLNNLCRKKNVELYIVLSNDKESIYPEFYPKYYKPNNNISRLEQVKFLLKTIPKLNVISQEENLLKAKQHNLIFLIYDTHLNALGSFIEYKTIISAINKKYPDINPIEDSDVEFYESIQKCDSIPPKKYANKADEYVDGIKLKKINSNLVKQIRFQGQSYVFREYMNDNVNNNKKLVIIGDSFHGRYAELLAENFYSVKSLFIGNGRDFVLDSFSKELLFNDKPDIIIVETTERWLQRLINMDSFKDILK